jgi:rhamnulose-1-phosphate aldolase
MSVLDSDCFARFSRLCEDGFAQGWHEANAGNLSYRLR